MKTLLLHPARWDLMLDSNGNIAMAAEPYAIAQDVASAARLFLGELWFDTKQGVPYFQKILGRLPPVALVKSQLEKAAMTVPGVVSAVCTVSEFSNRSLLGQITVTTAKGSFVVVATPGTGLGNFILDSSRLG
jgi:hypothetical protein